MQEKIKKLTSRESAFCRIYASDPDPRIRWNASRSAIKAGYSEKASRAAGCETLTKAYIKSEIEKIINETKESDEILKEKVIEERRKLAFSDIKDFIDPVSLDIKDLTEIDTSAVKKISVKNNKDCAPDTKIELHDKVKALDGLASYLGIDKQTLDIKTPKGELQSFLEGLSEDDLKAYYESNSKK